MEHYPWKGERMMASRDEIIIALNIIKKMCEEQGISCHHCPLRTREDPITCALMKKPPIAWKIKGDEDWRAFE
jgi:hypothetical protein